MKSIPHVTTPRELLFEALDVIVPLLESNLGFPIGHLRSCLRGLARRNLIPKLLLDAGANRGEWTATFKEVFPSANVIMIEPEYGLKPELDNICQTLGGCVWRNIGISDHCGAEVFTVRSDTYSSTFNIEKCTADKLGYTQKLVDVITLNQIVTDIGRIPDVVKLDIEGHELKALSAADKLFGITEVFFVEVSMFDDSGKHNGILDVMKTMENAGYVPYDFTWFYVRPFDRALALCEIAFAKRNGILRQNLGW